jgi:prepilin-type N-terminal cleavage/methylation domain-containing protein
MRRRQTETSDEGGFTLIELVIVTAVMPIIIGALTVGMISIFSLNSSVSGRLTDSSDAQQISLYMQNDLQSASSITTNASPSSPSPCLPTGSQQQQILAVQLGNGNEVTYGVTKASSDKGDELWRNVCPSGSTTPNDSKAVANDLPTDMIPPQPSYPFVIEPCNTTPASTVAACVLQPNVNNFPNPITGNQVPAFMNGWVSTQGIQSVTFAVTAPESKYGYKVTAVPVAASNTLQPRTPATGTTNCSFANSGSVPDNNNGGQICFIDFSPWDASPQVPATYTCQAAASNELLLPMAETIDNTPFTLEFCMYVSSNQPTGPTSAPAACGVLARSGYNDITAVPLPTYSCPGSDGSGSEAFLGNNGFYTGITGDPALYTVTQGSQATVRLTNIQLINSNFQAATGWRLVTGDAESTDGGESMVWTADQLLTLLANSTNSPIGNACGSTGSSAPPNFNSATGLVWTNNNMTVTCANAQSLNHTGTPMLQATTPTALTVTLNGGGLEAMFLGVILP